MAANFLGQYCPAARAEAAPVEMLQHTRWIPPLCTSTLTIAIGVAIRAGAMAMGAGLGAQATDRLEKRRMCMVLPFFETVACGLS
mmetsp:Transcript_1396/g.4562  ORF Transcript_1396/g.4562 Transcript_1396/m.4562 type:complete len:85 (-) Transcript_1396:904-1158(-)